MNKAFHMIWVQKHSRDWHWRPQQSWKLLDACVAQPGQHLQAKLPSAAQSWLLLQWGTGALTTKIPQAKAETALLPTALPKIAQSRTLLGAASQAKPPSSLHCMQSHLTETSQHRVHYCPESAIKVKYPGQCQNVRQRTKTSFLAKETVCPAHCRHCPSITAKGEG